MVAVKVDMIAIKVDMVAVKTAGPHSANLE